MSSTPHNMLSLLATPTGPVKVVLLESTCKGRKRLVLIGLLLVVMTRICAALGAYPTDPWRIPLLLWPGTALDMG